MKILRLLQAGALLAAMLLALTACEREGPMERTGERADEAVEETREGMKEAGEEAREAVR